LKVSGVKRDSPAVMDMRTQVNKEWKVDAEGLKPLSKQALELRGRFSSFEINHVYR